MTRINTGNGSHDIHYEDHEMSLSMKILKARLCQVLIENKFYDLRFKNAYFVYYNNLGGDVGYELNVPCSTINGNKIFNLHEKIREYYKGGIEICFDNDQGEYGFIYKVLDKSIPLCKSCKGKKFIREDGFGFIESCQACNSDFQLPFTLK